MAEKQMLSVEKLLENDKSIVFETLEILLKFANNVIKNPDNPKYRKIRVGNTIVMEKLLPVSGGVECLFDMGFQEDGEYFTLPSTADLKQITKFRDTLQQLRNETQEQSSSAPKNRSSEHVVPPEVINRPVPDFNVQSQTNFLKKLMSSVDHVKLYEDPNLQIKARTCIPVKRLTEQALNKQASLNTDQQTESIQIQDLLLLELLAWFKNDFFQWVNSPKCERCGATTNPVGHVAPTPAELMWGAGRVENYQCTECGSHTRFPRYNHPGKLLDTRKGRCGEWANCFTLCCRAMGFEARYVLDWTDHVWTEVFSDSQNRWLHCDPCENICDKPLVYESGWKKKLSYIFAFSKDDIQDVTWRYSSQHKEILSRRTEVPEMLIVNTIMRLRKQHQKHVSATRKKQLLDRLVTEIVEFMTPKVAGGGELGGRESGSLAWRLVRGETQANTSKSYSFIATENECKAKVMHIKYSCSLDKYIRVSDDGSVSQGWGSRTYRCSGMQRKVEHDWKMVYLARSEGTAMSLVEWKFNFGELSVDKIEVEALSTCYENGRVSWRLCSGDQCAILRKDGKRTEIDSLSGCQEITLTAELSLGQGDVSWQHTQLFRQSLSDTDTYPLEIKIFLKS